MTRVVIDIPDEDFTLLCEAFGEVELKSTLNLRLQSAVAHGTVLPEVEERPQGEWIFRTDTEWHFECNQCKGLSPWKAQFCGVCGADMRKGGTE